MTPPTTPKADAWVAAIHGSQDGEPFASGVLIDDRRVLTCAHVLAEPKDAATVGVSFPKAEGDAAEAVYSVANVVLPDGHGTVRDVAILVLNAPVPAGVTPAQLRCPKPGDLVETSWWAFGFPAGEPLGNTASGHVGSALGHGWVLLNTASRYPVATGFSGSGLWSPDYQAVVGLVGQANGANGDGLAITVHQADQWLAGHGLRSLAERVDLASAGEVALSAWGGALVGRTAAMEAIVGWLDRDAVDRKILVVTGNPGSGKSAVLGRVITTAAKGSVACAVHAKGLTALEVARQIAKAASTRFPERLPDFAPAVRAALTERAGRRFNVVIDALDEAASPAEARLVVSKVITPLTEISADAGVQVVVGTRRADAGGDLLASFAGAAKLVDLDDRAFFDEADLASYALATLRLSGGERPASPYADDAVAITVAHRIAAFSGNNFLVAGLTARSHGLYDEVAPDPATLSSSPKVDDAMHEYLNRVQPTGEDSANAEALLTALAFAESPGLPLPLWRVAVQALGGGETSETALLRFARSSGTSFLVESSAADDGADDGAGAGEGPGLRLFHQALNDALLRTRGSVVQRAADERSLARAFIAYGRESGWQNVPEYLLRSLPGHAQLGGLVDDLLTDDAYLIHADLRRLLRAAGSATTPAGQRRARLLRLTPLAATAAPAARAAMFSVTESLERMGDTYSRASKPVPYRAAWAQSTPRSERSVLVGHTARVESVCELAIDGRTYLASGGEDRTVRIWDPETGIQRTVLDGHQSAVNAVCAFTLDETAMLASGGGDRVVRTWNAETGARGLTLKGHTGWIAGICSFDLDGRPLLATGGYDQTVRIWDPAAGTLRLTLHGHTDRVTSLCVLALENRTLLASGSRDGTVRLWDPATGEQWPVVLRNPNYSDWVHAVVAFTLAGRQLLASAGADQVVRIWDPMTGLEELTLPDRTGMVRALAAFSLDGTPALAGGDDRAVRIWDLVTGQRFAQHGHTGTIRSVCPFTLNGTPLVATAGDDWTVRIWNPGSAASPAPETDSWEPDEVTSVCALTIDGVPLLITANSDSAVRAVDAADGHRRDFPANIRGGTAMCAFNAGEHPLLITADYDHTVRLWDPQTGTHEAIQLDGTGTILVLCAFTLGGHKVLGIVDSQRTQTVQVRDLETGAQLAASQTYPSRIRSLCAVSLHGDTLLAVGGADGTIGFWNPDDHAQRASLNGHDGRVSAVCAFEFGDHVFLASGGHDRTVLIWDLEKLECALTIPVHHPVNALSFSKGLLVAGTTAGLLALRLNTEAAREPEPQVNDG